MDRFSQDIAEALARTLDARQRELLLQLMRAMTRDAMAEGAGAGIWYITRAIEERIHHADRSGLEESL